MICMARFAALLIAGLIALAACGEDEPSAPRSEAPAEEQEPEREEAPAATKPKRGTEIVLAGSDFGSMLYDSRKQAIYVFERDGRNRSNCYGECAKAWPPVYAKGRPVAGRGVRKSLLGAVGRRDGRRQVTYAGKPLYFYAHEGPGEVLCHNVNLNGGLWWVVGASGEPLP
jgi:predicted lipoprotein with Yx(FWY)xxD motif